MLSILKFMQPAFMLALFGVGFLSLGTAITLLYKETTKKHEYYFFYNMGLSKLSLILTCAIGNLIVGLLCIILFTYVQHT